MKFSIDGLEALEAVVETGSFAAAAERLHKAQSAISYAVGQLESQLGVELFDRSGHRAKLTEAGQLILKEGRELLSVANRIESFAHRMKQEWEPRLEVVIDGILPMEPTMRALDTIVHEDIPTQIQVKIEFLGGVQYRFEQDDADIMLVKDFVPEPRLQAEPLSEVSSVLVTCREHPLSDLESVSLSDLHDHVELTVHDSSESDRMDPLFGGSRVFYLSDFAAKLRAIEMGIGFGWLPTHLIEDRLERGKLVEVAYEGRSRFSFTPMLVHRTDRRLGRCGRRLVDQLRANFNG